MAELEALATLTQIAGNLLVAAGLLFAAVQIKDYRRERADHAAIELARI